MHGQQNIKKKNPDRSVGLRIFITRKWGNVKELLSKVFVLHERVAYFTLSYEHIYFIKKILIFWDRKTSGAVCRYEIFGGSCCFLL